MNEFRYTIALSEATAAQLPCRLLCLCGSDRGDGQSVAAVARHLSDEGWRVTVSTLSSGRSGRFPGSNVIQSMLMWRRHAQDISQADVVYLSSGAEVGSIMAILPAIVIARHFGKRVVLHFGLLESEKYLSRWRNVLNPIFRMADQIIVNSRYTASVFSRYGLRAKTVTSPVEIDSITWREIESVQPRILVDRPLEPIYNVSCVLAAFRLVKQKYPRAELIIAGRGSKRAELARIVERDRLSGVTFAEVTDDSSRQALFAQADVYANASLLDDMPLSIVEAMAAGLPVVTTDVGGIGQMVRDRGNGLTVSVSDYAAMAERIIELVEHPELARKLSVQGRNDAARFCWGATRAGWVTSLSPATRE